jgi:predicted transcriptional regulator
MKKAGSDIPASELEVLGSLWRLGSGTVREVLEDLQKQGRRLAYTTVLTLLGRLEGRGYVHSRRNRQAHVYRPGISREQVVADRLGALARHFQGEQPVPLILKLVESQKLSAGDLRKLRKLLRELEDEARKRGS